MKKKKNQPGRQGWYKRNRHLGKQLGEDKKVIKGHEKQVFILREAGNIGKKLWNPTNPNSSMWLWVSHLNLSYLPS